MSEHDTNHDNRGRFVAGNPGGPGRPTSPRKRQYMDALATHISLEHWNEIVDRAVKDAISGDHRARVWLTESLMGKTAQTLNLQNSDTALLADVLSAYSARGLSPAEIFQAMLDEIADEPPFDASSLASLPSGE